MTEEVKAAYVADGVVKVTGVVPETMLSDIAGMAQRELDNPGEWVTDTNPGSATNRLFTSRYRWKTDAVVNRYIYESGVAQIAAALMDSSSARALLRSSFG